MSEHDPTTNPEQEPNLRPRVWIGSWADYNEGRLHGDWCDAAVDTETLWVDVQAILSTSQDPSAEDFGIFDHDGFGGYQPGESDPLEHVAMVARGIAEHGPPFAAWAELHGGDPSMLDGFTDAYLGEYESAAAWAKAVADELDIKSSLDTLDEFVRRYVSIDYAAIARDARFGGDVYLIDTPHGGVFVFEVGG